MFDCVFNMEFGQIFFSYARKDKEFALRLATDLKRSGVFIWIDQLNIDVGERWDLEIAKALENASTLLVVLSNSSVLSNNVLDEVSYALETNKRLIPVKIDDCALPFRLRRFQYIDFTKEYNSALGALKISLQAATNHEAGQEKRQTPESPQALQSDIDESESEQEVVSKFIGEENTYHKKRRLAFIGSIALIVLVSFLLINPFGRKSRDRPDNAGENTRVNTIDDSNVRGKLYENAAKSETNKAYNNTLTNSKPVNSQTTDLKEPHELPTNVINASQALAGKRVYDIKCSSCHRLSEEKVVGPGWSGITKRHTQGWLTYFFTTTSAASSTLETCLVSMPNQALSNEEAASVYEFMRKNDIKISKAGN